MLNSGVGKYDNMSNSGRKSPTKGILVLKPQGAVCSKISV